ncbi:TfoX/Sxy family protein [Streptomyces sp. NBC_00510]
MTEKRMFGGLAFLYEGNVAVGVAGDQPMVRVGPDATEAALARPGTRPFESTGRPMRGWVVVTASAVSEDEAPATWTGACATCHRDIPTSIPTCPSTTRQRAAKRKAKHRPRAGR